VYPPRTFKLQDSRLEPAIHYLYTCHPIYLRDSLILMACGRFRSDRLSRSAGVAGVPGNPLPNRNAKRDGKKTSVSIPEGNKNQNQMKEGTIPLREERKVCYLARDAFFTCCDKNNIDNPMKEVEMAQKKCGAERAKFERDCVGSWVRYL